MAAVATASAAPEAISAYVRTMARTLGISAEHASAFSSAAALWRARLGLRVRFDYESLCKKTSYPMGRVTKVVPYGDALDARGELPEEQSVVISIGGRGSYRVWPEDRARGLDVLPSAHPLAALVKDIEFSRCGRDGEMRLSLRCGHFLRPHGFHRDHATVAWAFDMDASRLLYVFPTEVRDVAQACPAAFPSLKRVQHLAPEAVLATTAHLEPEAEDDLQ